MARAQAVWRKSGGRISVTARLLPAPYLAQHSPPKSRPAISPQSSSPLRRSEAMAGACSPAVTRSLAAAFAGVPSPSSPTLFWWILFRFIALYSTCKSLAGLVESLPWIYLSCCPQSPLSISASSAPWSSLPFLLFYVGSKTFI
jgi:hypothetical protein